MNAVFAPNQTELEHTRALLAAGEASDTAGAFRFAGKFVDRPVLERV